MIGAAIGGVLVHPAHNLHYVEGTYFWAGVMPMALIGIARAFEIDFTPYLTARGLRLYHDMQATSIVNVLGQPAYWRLKWSDLVNPAYPTPESLPLFVTLANKLIMGTGGTPTIPLFIGQGANGDLEWTPGNKPGIGAGDGVMIAGDVRTLARTYCARAPRSSTSNTTCSATSRAVGIWLLQGDRLDQRSLRRTACAAELFVDHARQSARPDSGSIALSPEPKIRCGLRCTPRVAFVMVASVRPRGRSGRGCDGRRRGRLHACAQNGYSGLVAHDTTITSHITRMFKTSTRHAMHSSAGARILHEGCKSGRTTTIVQKSALWQNGFHQHHVVCRPQRQVVVQLLTRRPGMEERPVDAAGELHRRHEQLLWAPRSLRRRRSPCHDVVGAVGVEHQVLLEIGVELGRHFAYRAGDHRRGSPRIGWDPGILVGVPVFVLS